MHNGLTLFPSPKERDGAFCKSKHYIFHIIFKIVSANLMYIIKSFLRCSLVCAFASLPFRGRFRGGYSSLPISYLNAQLFLQLLPCPSHRSIPTLNVCPAFR